MKLQKVRLAFTLIELLVVITIIGILATGAVSIFTSQIQKARDSTRISSIEALKASVEQVYQDTGEYPHADLFFTEVQDYLETMPSDPKHSQPCNDNGVTGGVDCGYAYITSTDANGILYGTYELSSAFENSGNLTARAESDSGTDDLRLEMGIDTAGNDTVVDDGDITGLGTSGACTPAGAVAVAGTDLIIINGNPATAGNECG
ncbi:MAG: type II secretion system protein [Candidatus Gracilibacteria bacterium]|nr:type II secretion system protein [Candidatus Gracilibacteria bacterium]